MVEDGIATVSINRPERRNALSIEVSNGLTRAWTEIDANPAVRVAVLTSADCGTFCAGLDLKEAAEVRSRTGKDILEFIEDPFQKKLRGLRVPIVAAMTGDLFGGGMMLSLGCDLRVGLSSTRVGITESRLGRGAPWAVPLLWMLPQPLVSELILTGETAPIERFTGFINYIEPDPDSVRARALALARRIRDNAPLSIAAGKRSIRAAMDLGCERGLSEADAIYRPVYESEDAQEGPRAFSEKRPPRWQGR